MDQKMMNYLYAKHQSSSNSDLTGITQEERFVVEDSVEQEELNEETLDTMEVESRDQLFICRLCGRSGSAYVPIFGNDNLSVAEKISRCLPIVVLSNDDLPSHVCSHCLHKLNISYKLIVTSMKVDSRLRQQLTIRDHSSSLNDISNLRESKESQVSTIDDNILDTSTKKLNSNSIYGPMECEMCSLIFTDMNEFDNHVETMHLLSWRCSLCEKSFETSDKLVAHKQADHAGNVLICTSCIDQERLTHGLLSLAEMQKSRKCFEHENNKIVKECSETDLRQKKSRECIKTEETSKESIEVGKTSKEAIEVGKTSKEFIEVGKTPKEFIEVGKTPKEFMEVGKTSKEYLEVLKTLRESIKVGNTSKEFIEVGKTSRECTEVDQVQKMVKDMNKNDKNLNETKKSVKKRLAMCDICKIAFGTKELLVTHQKIHQPEKHHCHICETNLTSIYELFLHKQQVHNIYKKMQLKFVCGTCGKFFSNNWQWLDHEKKVCKDKSMDYTCKYCKRHFTTSYKLTRHLRTHRTEMLEDPTVRIYRCVVCPKVFVDKEFYQKHRNVHDPECLDKLRCELCNKSFRDKRRLQEHRESIHEGLKPHKCDVCERAFHRFSNMTVHRKKHFDKKCEHCGEEFAKLRLLADHIREVHKLEPNFNLPPKRIYTSGCHVCRYCGKKLATYQSLLDHEHIHTDEKPYKCKVCDKTFRSYTARWSHSQRHVKGTYTCEHCAKSFSYKSNLSAHMRVHLPIENRKHLCTTCNKRFLRKTHLNVHMRIHSGVRPFTCDICQASFTQVGDMRRHRARHEIAEYRGRKRRGKPVEILPTNGTDK